MKKDKKQKTLQRIMEYMKPYRFLIFASLVLAVISVALTLYVPILTGQGVDCIISKGNVDFARLICIIKTIVICIVLTAAAQWLMNHVNNQITYKIGKDLRIQAFEHLQKLPLSYVDAHSSGDLISRIVTDIDQFTDGLLLGFTQLFTGVITIIGTICFMLGINPWITLVVVILSPFSFFIASFISKRSFNMFRKQSQTRGNMTGFVNEMLGNIKVVKVFDHGEKAQEEFDQINDDLAYYSLRATFFSSITNPATRFMYSGIYAGVAIAGCMSVIRGSISVGQLSSFLSYTNQYTKPFNEISGVVTEFQNAVVCAGRIFELIEEIPQPEDAKDAAVLTHVRGHVLAEHVDFSYMPQQNLITDFNLKVMPGQKIAVVGPTGCGKTTLINLLMRFYDVDGGCISVDGKDVREVTRESLRCAYGMVLQETWLKTGTIRENILLGRPDASEEEMIEAAKASYIHNVILRLPNGYDTWATEDGGGLSQGQKQLLCIARVMLCRPPMLILDEATSSIDTRTEVKIQAAFTKLMEGRTTFIVAHRLSTIREADVILVMKDGKVIEQGNHESLMAADGFYRHLYESQFLRGTDADK